MVGFLDVRVDEVVSIIERFLSPSFGGGDVNSVTEVGSGEFSSEGVSEFGDSAFISLGEGSLEISKTSGTTVEVRVEDHLGLVDEEDLFSVTTQITVSVGEVVHVNVVEGLMHVTDDVDQETHHDGLLDRDILLVKDGDGVVLL